LEVERRQVKQVKGLINGCFVKPERHTSSEHQRNTALRLYKQSKQPWDTTKVQFG
jgi:hypothetical protein